MEGDPSAKIELLERYHPQESWDDDSNAPSRKFMYDFELIEWLTNAPVWRDVLRQADDGAVLSGSVSALAEASSRGCTIKVAVAGLCDDLSEASGQPQLAHEVFVDCHSHYHYSTSTKETGVPTFTAATQPLPRVAPGTPTTFQSNSWDYSWLHVSTSGEVAQRRLNPCNPSVSRLYPFNTGYSPLSYSGNPGVNDVSYR